MEIFSLLVKLFIYQRKCTNFIIEEEKVIDTWSVDNFQLFQIHIYDYSHAMCNVHGAFISRQLILPDFLEVVINSSRLLKLRMKYPKILIDKVLPPLVYAPADKMNMVHCLLLFNQNICKTLKKIERVASCQDDIQAAGNQ